MSLLIVPPIKELLLMPPACHVYMAPPTFASIVLSVSSEGKTLYKEFTMNLKLIPLLESDHLDWDGVRSILEVRYELTWRELPAD